MKIRKATEHELLELWGYENIHTASSNARFFCDNIKRGNTEFWTLDYDGELIGELYVFYDLEDKDFADGKRTAYLCAFRVRTDFRGQGKSWIEMLKEKNINATINENSLLQYEKIRKLYISNINEVILK